MNLIYINSKYINLDHVSIINVTRNEDKIFMDFLTLHGGILSSIEFYKSDYKFFNRSMRKIQRKTKIKITKWIPEKAGLPRYENAPPPPPKKR